MGQINDTGGKVCTTENMYHQESQYRYRVKKAVTTFTEFSFEHQENESFFHFDDR